MWSITNAKKRILTTFWSLNFTFIKIREKIPFCRVLPNVRNPSHGIHPLGGTPRTSTDRIFSKILTDYPPKKEKWFCLPDRFCDWDRSLWCKNVRGEEKERNIDWVGGADVIIPVLSACLITCLNVRHISHPSAFLHPTQPKSQTLYLQTQKRHHWWRV